MSNELTEAPRPAAQAELEALRVALAAFAATRSAPATPSLFRSYGVIAISLVVLLAYSATIYALFTRTVPLGQSDVLKDLLTTLQTLASAVVFYWIGTSHSSATKNDALAASLPAETVERLLKPPA